MTEASPTKPSGSDFIPPTPAPPPSASVTPAPAQPAAGKAELPHSGAVNHADQLARIEDKTARIEDKYARSEALLSRVEEKVESASTRMNDAARQADLSSLRSEVRTLSDRIGRLPGTGALVLTAIVTAVLTVALMVAVQRLNLDRMLPHGVGGQGQTAPANPSANPPASNP
ncbi:MAG: hypothetical protein PGN25_18180 [Methylorubrum populi]